MAFVQYMKHNLRALLLRCLPCLFQAYPVNWVCTTRRSSCYAADTACNDCHEADMSCARIPHGLQQ